MTKEQITQVRRAAMMHAHGYSPEQIQKGCGVSSRTLLRWSTGFIWNEALDFIGFDGVREVARVRTGFGEWAMQGRGLTMLGKAQIKAIRRGVNFALGLTEAHKFGHEFVWHFVEFRCEFPNEVGDVPVTTYERMRNWVHSHRFEYLRMDRTGEHPVKVYSEFRLTPNRYQILIGILECLQAVLRVELLNEGGDKSLPPDVPKDAPVRSFTKSGVSDESN